MNKEIAKMLKYQEVDMKLYQLERKLKNSEDAKALMASSAKRKELRENLLNVNREASDLMKSIEKNEEEFNIYIAQFGELENNLNDNITIEEIEFYLKKIDSVVKKIEKLENLTLELKRKLEDLRKNADGMMKESMRCAQIVKEKKPLVEKMKEDLMKDAKEYNDRLKAIVKEQNISSEDKVFKRYKEVKTRRMPVFVEVTKNGKDFSCSGYGVEIPLGISDEATNNGYAECPNCGRILYSKD